MHQQHGGVVKLLHLIGHYAVTYALYVVYEEYNLSFPRQTFGGNVLHVLQVEVLYEYRVPLFYSVNEASCLLVHHIFRYEWVVMVRLICSPRVFSVNDVAHLVANAF